MRLRRRIRTTFRQRAHLAQTDLDRYECFAGIEACQLRLPERPVRSGEIVGTDRNQNALVLLLAVGDAAEEQRENSSGKALHRASWRIDLRREAYSTCKIFFNASTLGSTNRRRSTSTAGSVPRWNVLLWYSSGRAISCATRYFDRNPWIRVVFCFLLPGKNLTVILPSSSRPIVSGPFLDVGKR